MARETCYRCNRPRAICLCPSAPPMATRTRIVLLMHPKEHRRERCTTGRLTCLNLSNSEIVTGVEFDGHPRVRALVDDPTNRPMLLYPGDGALNLSDGFAPAPAPVPRRLVVFIIDGTWVCSRTIMRRNPGLQRLPRLMFTPREKSRFVIKRQPHEWCLSTLEAAHGLLLALEAAGLDEYPDKARLPAVFDAMQQYQIERAAANARPRFRRPAGAGRSAG